MSESNNDGLDHAVLKLSPQEKAAYSHLFNLADSDSLGVVTGERAVSFFEKTQVPAPVLGEIWQIADTENRGLLTKPGFCMVLRLIGWYQNGQQQPTAELAFKAAPIPKFDGITLPTAAPQQQQAASPTTGAFPTNTLQPQLSGQNQPGAPIRVPPLDPAKVQQYSGLFEKSGVQNGILDGGTAKSIFERAGLPNEVLGKIWMLSDREQRGGLDQTEFIVAMHLLTSMKTRAMTALPTSLPQGLWDAAARRGQRPVSRQMSGQPGGMQRQFTPNQPPRTQSPLARPPGYASPPPQSAQPTGTNWLVTPQEKAQYDQFFANIDTAGKGVLSGEQAVSFFSDSRLPEDTLAQIWDLADINSEGQLNRDEFAVAMHLIKQQRSSNPPAVPAFLPALLVPPSMRGPQQQQQAQQQQATQQAAPPAMKSASEDLFGLDSSPTQPQQQQQSLQPQGTGASSTRDPFAGSQPSSPTSPQRFQPQQQQGSGTMFKPFVPSSAFGTSLTQQATGTSATSSQGQARGFQQGQQAPASSNMDDLLGDNEATAEESSKVTNESTELANMSSQIGNLRTQMEATQNKKTATQADLNATNAQKKDLEQRLQAFRAQYETEVKSVKEMEQQLSASREETKKLSQEFAMLEGTYQDLHTQHNTVGQQLQADQQENASLKQRIGQMNAEVARLKPEIEKMKLDARQQKGLVSINKKQLATNEAERDRLQNDKADLERGASEQARSAATSPEPPAVTSQASNVVSPAASTMSSTNPFFKKTGGEGSAVTTPAATAPSGPTPSAFDTLFGPAAAFAPTGQAGSRTGTPPATSFIGRTMPTAGAAAAGVGAGAVAAAGGVAVADSMSSAGDATPPSSSAGQPPPPPPESRQFTPTSLPLGGVGGEGKAESETANSTMASPPASRAGGAETPRDLAGTPAPASSAPMPGAFSPSTEPDERDVMPGGFPVDQVQPTTAPEEASASKTNDDFDSAFASFGQGDQTKEKDTTEDPFGPSSSQQPPSQGTGFQSEFPPIQSLEKDDDYSESDSEAEGFDDDFARSAPQQNGASAPTIATVASGDDIASSRPDFKSVESTASDLPVVGTEKPPPSYERSDSLANAGSAERTDSNQFPPEFGGLLPSREDPTSPPPPDTTAPTESANFQSSSDAFVDAPSQPASSATAPQAAESSQPKNAFDEFDDFDDLSEAKEADKSGTDFDFGFGRPSVEEFNPAFDSPAPSQTATPMMRSVQQSQDNGNSFNNFTPNFGSTNAGTSGGGDGSIQQTPQNTQHDWDAIFSGLDSSENVDTSLGKSDPWATTNGNGNAENLSATNTKSQMPELGRAITPTDEHDDPILKRLTGMGYSRSDALNALEMYDYDINKAVDHLTSA